VACIYCGREIGPIRLFRDSEFCSDRHRQEYEARLRKALVQIDQSGCVSTSLAPFAELWRVQDGKGVASLAPPRTPAIGLRGLTKPLAEYGSARITPAPPCEFIGLDYALARKTATALGAEEPLCKRNQSPKLPDSIPLASECEELRSGESPSEPAYRPPPMSGPMAIPAAPVEREVQPRVASVRALEFPALPAVTRPDPPLRVREERFLRIPESEPTARIVNASPALLEPVRALPPISGADLNFPPPAIPSGSFLALEQRAQQSETAPHREDVTVPYTPGLLAPALTLQPVFDRVEEREARQQERQPPSFAEIFTISEAARRSRGRLAEHAGKAIAASILVASGLWVGAHSARMARQWVLNRDAANPVATTYAPSAPGLIQHSGSGHLHPMAWARSVVARRAAVEVTDTFRKGMQAWSTAARNVSTGWTRHPDGYVIPGQLALFQPSLGFTDYRLEFLGQIETKGMSWVVRAHDRQNYYAMRFHVIEPGLRPVLSMVHYPVVGGKPGHSVEVPLSIMVHNNTAYHVTVDVRGNRFAASIEGQEVDSWTDDTPASGGVGFFSEAGERARLYWMKVSKNDDWLGRICAFLSGSSTESVETAWRGRSGPLPARPQPGNGEAVLAAGETAESVSSGSRRPRNPIHGRIRTWNS
jgi:hypothetical protein